MIQHLVIKSFKAMAFKFEDLKVWQVALDLNEDIHVMTQKVSRKKKDIYYPAKYYEQLTLSH